MHRSGSWSRASEYYMSANASPAAIRLSTAFEDHHHHHHHHHQEKEERLPLYHPAMEKEKDNKSRDKFAERAVHVIPFVLIACALVLWLFSNPDVEVVGVLKNIPGGAAARVEGLTLDGDIEHDSDGTQTLLPIPLDTGLNFRTGTTSNYSHRLRTTLTNYS